MDAGEKLKFFPLIRIFSMIFVQETIAHDCRLPYN